MSTFEDLYNARLWSQEHPWTIVLINVGVMALWLLSFFSDQWVPGRAPEKPVIISAEGEALLACWRAYGQDDAECKQRLNTMIANSMRELDEGLRKARGGR